jgi:hypothetical protein
MQNIKGYRLSEDLRTFLSDLKNLQQMVDLLEKDKADTQSLTSSAIENFLIIIRKDAENEQTSAPVASVLRAVEAGHATLQIVDAVTVLETLPLLYELAESPKPAKELVIVAVAALEAISVRCVFSLSRIFLLLLYLDVVFHYLFPRFSRLAIRLWISSQ